MRPIDQDDLDCVSGGLALTHATTPSASVVTPTPGVLPFQTSPFQTNPYQPNFPYGTFPGLAPNPVTFCGTGPCGTNVDPTHPTVGGGLIPAGQFAPGGGVGVLPTGLIPSGTGIVNGGGVALPYNLAGTIGNGSPLAGVVDAITHGQDPMAALQGLATNGVTGSFSDGHSTVNITQTSPGNFSYSYSTNGDPLPGGTTLTAPNAADPWGVGNIPTYLQR